MKESGKTPVDAEVTVWSADRNTRKGFFCPCNLKSIKREGCKALFGSDKGCEKTELVREDEGTGCCDDEVLYRWVVDHEYRLQLLRPGEIWVPASATPGEILEREMRLKEKMEERQHKIRDREISLKEETKKSRETGNKVAIGIGAVGGSVALVGAGIAACCACPPLAVVGILAGVGGSTLTAGSVGYVCTLPPSD